MSADVLRQFQSYVENAYSLWRSRSGGIISQNLPRAFRLLVTEDQKKVRDDKAKYTFIRSPIGNTAIMCINDKTENLSSYINPSSADFSKSLFSLFSSFVWFFVMLSSGKAINTEDLYQQIQGEMNSANKQLTKQKRFDVSKIYIFSKHRDLFLFALFSGEFQFESK